MRKLIQKLRQDWHDQPVTVSLEVVGTATSMVAAVLLSFELTGLIPVYVFWMIGSVSLMISSIQRQNMNLMMLMMFYTIMNMIGFWNYL
jgi:hypothetical protein